MEVLIKAAVIGAVAALCGLVVKKSNPEISLLLAVAAAAVILSLAVSLLGQVRETAKLVASFSGLQSVVVAPVLKCVAVGIVARIAADMCKDAGQSSVASAVELTGAAAAVCISLPLVNALLQMIGGLA